MHTYSTRKRQRMDVCTIPTRMADHAILTTRVNRNLWPVEKVAHVQHCATCRQYQNHALKRNREKHATFKFHPQVYNEDVMGENSWTFIYAMPGKIILLHNTRFHISVLSNSPGSQKILHAISSSQEFQFPQLSESEVKLAQKFMTEVQATCSEVRILVFYFTLLFFVCFLLLFYAAVVL